MITETTYMMLRDQLKKDEGKRLKPYRCSAGKLSIGYGRNLEDNGISDKEANYLLDNDIQVAITEIKKLVGSFDRLNGPRQAVLVNMMFNIGAAGLVKFKRFLAALETGDYTQAAQEMENSTWYHQVKGRADRLCKQMETGQWVG